jgi:Ca2+-binding RTX toxin-like protein
MRVSPDLLEGGAGDDTLITTNGGTMTGGPGADTFGVVHDVDSQAQFDAISFPPAVITDFTEGEDVLFVDVRPETIGSGAGEITVDVWEDMLGADVLLDGIVVARVAGGQGLTPGDIIRSDQIDIPF